jgi:hypothetical protein
MRKTLGNGCSEIVVRLEKHGILILDLEPASPLSAGDAQSHTAGSFNELPNLPSQLAGTRPGKETESGKQEVWQWEAITRFGEGERRRSSSGGGEFSFQY